MKTLLLSLLSLSSTPLLPQLLSINNIQKQFISEEDTTAFIPEIEFFKGQDIIKFYFDNVRNDMLILTRTGLYKSKDMISFNQVKFDFSFYKLEDIIIDSMKNVYLVVRKDTTGKFDIYKSTDAINFKHAYTTPVTGGTSAVLSCTSSGVFLGSYRYIYASGNVVENWSLMATLPIGSSITNLLFNQNMMLIASQKGLYVSNGFIDDFKLVNKIGATPVQAFNYNDKIYVTSYDKTHYYVAPDVNPWNPPGGNGYEEPPFVEIKLNNNFKMQEFMWSSDGTMWAVTGNWSNQLYKSNDGINFDEVGQWNYLSNSARSLIEFNGEIFIGGTKGLLKLNNSDSLFLDMNTPDYQGQGYNGFVFKKEQKINIKEDYIISATLDGKRVTVPAKDIPITSGEHTLVISLKPEFKTYALLYAGGNKNGEIKYNFLIKPGIQTNDVAYTVNQDDTELLQGLTSNAGNTVDKEIIQTRIKDDTGSHTASLNIKITDALVDFSKSYYVVGNVDENNNFSATGTQEKITKENNITKDGIYHLFIVDFLGNSYESYLELGEENWKLQGAFNDQELDELAAKLNVVVKFSDPSERQKALTWLKNYQSKADKALKDAVKSYGKEFEISLKDIGNYKSFLDPIEYHGSDTKEAINYQKLNSSVTAIADKKLNNELEKLPNNLNIDTKNVNTKSSLEAYKTWVLNYDKYIIENKDKWIDETINTIGRGFATNKQIQQIKKIAGEIPLQQFLKHVVWNNSDTWSTSMKTTTNYEELVDLEEFHKIINTWVQNNLPEIEEAYKSAIQSALSGLDLHGYSVEELMGGRTMPQTKAEIENFADNMSFHDWLQAQANAKFKSNNLSLGLSIGVPIAVIVLALIVFGFWRYNTKYNPAGARKKLKIRTKKLNDDSELEIE